MCLPYRHRSPCLVSESLFLCSPLNIEMIYMSLGRINWPFRWENCSSHSSVGGDSVCIGILKEFLETAEKAVYCPQTEEMLSQLSKNVILTTFPKFLI